MNRLRVGVMGCADIVSWGLMDHVDLLPEIVVTDISSRDPLKAKAWAERFGIPRSSTYEEMVDIPDLDLVYLCLPNGLHAEWTIRLLRAGKAVLCEKPSAANEQEALQMVAAAKETGTPLIEAVHYRYHPLAKRLVEVARSGVLGRLRKIRAHCLIADGFFRENDIRYSYELAGGATMDTGFYPISVARLVTGEEPVVRSAKATKLAGPDIDVEMRAELEFPGGCIAEVGMSLEGRDQTEIRLVVEGEDGVLDVTNFPVPHLLGHTWKMQIGGQTYEERFEMKPTFVFQMREAVGVVKRGDPVRTPMEDGVLHMRVVDAIYEAAGMRARGKTTQKI